MVLLEITGLVATTPFTVVVKVLPERVWVKLLIILVIALATPLTRVEKVLVVVESELRVLLASI